MDIEVHENLFNTNHANSNRNFYRLQENHDVKHRTISKILKNYAIKAKNHLTDKKYYKNLLFERLPIIKLLKDYKKSYLLNDTMSGFTVGIMSLPQSMGYAFLASLPPVQGLYMAFFPLFMYIIFGTSRHLSFGAIAIISMLSGEVISNMADNYKLNLYAQNNNATNSTIEVNDLEPLIIKYKITVGCSLAFLTGLIQILLGISGLGCVTNYFSDSFVSAYTCGTAIHVFTSQIKEIFGLKNIKRFNGFLKIPRTITNIFYEIPKTNIATFVLSIICFIYLIIYKEIINPRIKKRFKIEFPSELLLVILVTTFSYFFKINEVFSISIVNNIPTGFPTPAVPNFMLWFSFFKTGVLIAVIAFSMNISLATLFARKHRYNIDSSQELYAYGITNIFASFFGCYPNAASLSRSTVLEASGAKSQIAAIFSSAITIVVILFVGKYLEPLPKTCLACIIMVALKNLLIQVRDFFTYIKINIYEAITWIGTFLSVVLLDVDIGLVFGLILSVFLIIYKDQRFSTKNLIKHKSLPIFIDSTFLNENMQNEKYIIIKIETSLYFANTSKFKNDQSKLAEKIMKNYKISYDENENSKEIKAKNVIFNVLLDFSAVNYIDTNGVKTLLEIIDDYEHLNMRILICNSQSHFVKMIKNMGLLTKIEDKLYRSIHEALSQIDF